MVKIWLYIFRDQSVFRPEGPAKIKFCPSMHLRQKRPGALAGVSSSASSLGGTWEFMYLAVYLGIIP